MFLIPNDVYVRYVDYLNKRRLTFAYSRENVRWLRLYLEFCNKFPAPVQNSERIRQFIGQLRDENRSQAQLNQAAHAISLYFEMQKLFSRSHGESSEPGNLTTVPAGDTPSAQIQGSPYTSTLTRRSHYSDAGFEHKSDSPQWDEAVAALAAEIKVRHYSRKTLKTYAQWTRRFQRFLKNKPPQDLATADVRAYLTFLAVKCQVAASTQNQAFNSLLFFFRHALKRDFGELRDVP